MTATDIKDISVTNRLSVILQVWREEKLFSATQIKSTKQLVIELVFKARKKRVMQLRGAGLEEDGTQWAGETAQRRKEGGEGVKAGAPAGGSEQGSASW